MVVAVTARSSDLTDNTLHAEQQAPFVFRHGRVEPIRLPVHTMILSVRPRSASVGRRRRSRFEPAGACRASGTQLDAVVTSVLRSTTDHSLRRKRRAMRGSLMTQIDWTQSRVSVSRTDQRRRLPTTVLYRRRPVTAALNGRVVVPLPPALTRVRRRLPGGQRTGRADFLFDLGQYGRALNTVPYTAVARGEPQSVTRHDNKAMTNGAGMEHEEERGLTQFTRDASESGHIEARVRGSSARQQTPLRTVQ